MISEMEWISILKCPITGSDLRELDHDELKVLHQKSASHQLWYSDGHPMSELIEQGLIAVNGTYIYPIIKQIVVLIKDLAIIDSPDKVIQQTINADKQWVKNFYDEKGWIANAEGDYADAVIYEDLRDVSRDYLVKCHNRVNRFLKNSGKYMLDAASGALQFPEYLQYSANYQYRVCLDFSFQALLEAKKKLGDKGLFILGDMTNMPFKDGVMDGFISLNTIYHIPKEEQVIAINELYRVLATNGKGVVVYDWFKHSAWMNIWMFPFRGFVFIKNRLLDGVSKLLGTRGVNRRLYFYSHTPKYLLSKLPPYQLKVWRTLSVHFMRYYIHSWLFGKQILNWVYRQEEKEPELCGLRGEYPMFVFEKLVTTETLQTQGNTMDF
ncbi:MAG: class I SAM-dependent methyltransferase [Chitinophagaceae bacterium]